MLGHLLWTNFRLVEFDLQEIKDALNCNFVLVLFVLELMVVNKAELTLSQSTFVASLEIGEVFVVDHLFAAHASHVLDVS